MSAHMKKRPTKAHEGFIEIQHAGILYHFPKEIDHQDLKDFFWLSDDARTKIQRLRGDHNKLGFALQLTSLSYLGFFPDDIQD